MSLRVNSLGVNTQSSSDSATTLISNRALIDHNYEGIVTSAGSVTKWLNTANRNQSAYFDGVNDTISTPDSGALTLTGATQTWEWIGLAAVDWTPVIDDTFGSQWDLTGNQRSWRMDYSPTGSIVCYTSSDGIGNTPVNFGSPSFTDGSSYDIKIERVASSGLLTCSTRATGGAYAVLSTGTGVVGALYGSTAALKLAGNSSTSNQYNGTLKAFRMYDDDRLAASWSADNYTDYNATTMESIGPELVPNNDLSDWAVSTAPDNWVMSGVNANNYVEQAASGMRLVSDGSIITARPDFLLTIGDTYTYTLVVSEMVDDSISVTYNGVTEDVIAAAGTYTGTFTATATTIAIKRRGSTGAVDAVIDSLSVKRVTTWTLNNGAIIRDPYDMDVLLGTGGLRRHDSGALLLDGVSGSYVSTPDSPAASVTGDCILYGYVQPVDNTPTGNQTIISKLVGSGNQRTFVFEIDSAPTTGLLQLIACQDGITTSAYPSTVVTGIADGVGYWAFAVLDVGTNVTFYTSLSSPSVSPATAYAAATQLGTAVTVTQTALFDGTAPIEIGGYVSGAAGTVFNGQIHRAGIIAGLDPTVTPSVDFDARLAGLTAGAGDKFFGAEMLKPSARTINASDWTEVGTGSITDNGDGTVTVDDQDATAFRYSVRTPLQVLPPNTPVVFSGTFSQGTAAEMRIVVVSTGVGSQFSGGAYVWATGALEDQTTTYGAMSFVDNGDGTVTFTVPLTPNNGNTSYYADIIPAGADASTTGSVIVHGEVSLQSEWTLNGGAKIQNSGQAVVQARGVGGIETTVAPVNIPTPMTMFMVGKADLLNAGIFNNARDNSTAGPFIRATESDFIFDAGFPITHTSDADLHLHTVRHNGDATTSYQIDSGTPVVGDAGAEEYNFGTFFCNTVATGSYLTGSMGRFLLFDEELSDAEVAFIQTLLLPN
jgi:hypothetical protein